MYKPEEIANAPVSVTETEASDGDGHAISLFTILLFKNHSFTIKNN